MVSRSTFARIAVGILLGAVLGVVLHESNMRQVPLNLRGELTTSATAMDSSGSCAGGTFWSHGACGVNCTIVPQVYPDCPGGYTDAMECFNAYQQGCPSSYSSFSSLGCGFSYPTCDGECPPGESCYLNGDTANCECTTGSSYSSSTPEYCCSGAGVCEEVFLGLTTCVGATYSSMGDCSCPSSSSSSSSSENYCCNVLTGFCEVIISSSTSAGCTGDGGDCSGSACCGGLYCDSSMVCVPGTPE